MANSRNTPWDSPACRPTVITFGPDGALWFTRSQDHQIGRITVDGGTEAFRVPTPGSGPFGITAGPDDMLWFTQMNTDRLGRITSKGEITEFTLPVEGAFPSMITTGPDGALWFTLNQANAIGRITVGGDVALYPLPTPGAAPVGITSDGDALWFVKIAAGQIGRISTDGGIKEFPLPDRTAKPHAIAATSAGDCWFTEWGPTASAASPRPARSPSTTCRHRRPNRTASRPVPTLPSGWLLRREGSRASRGSRRKAPYRVDARPKQRGPE